MRFGEGLRAERERRGISLSDVAVSTRISLRHLQALESDRFSDLPGGVFNRGIVRSYARHCGLDEAPTVQNFLKALRESGQPADTGENDWTEFAQAVHRNRVVEAPPQRIRWVGVVAMLVGVLLVAALVLLVLVRRGLVHLPGHWQGIAEHLADRLPLFVTGPAASDPPAGGEALPPAAVPGR